MATPFLYDPTVQVPAPIMQGTNDPSSGNMGAGRAGLAAVFSPNLAFSIGCIDTGVVSNTTGQGQIYPTGRN